MMIIKMVPKKLPSKKKQNVKSLKICSAEEFTMMHVEFCWSKAVSSLITEIVEFDVSNMMAALLFKLSLLWMPSV